MYLGAERATLVNQTILSTFEQTSVIWQAIPHWETCDPGQFRVRADLFPKVAAKAPEEDPLLDVVSGPSIAMGSQHVRFLITVTQATAPTPDALLATVIGRTADLAARFDKQVLDTLRTAPGAIEVSLADTSAATATKESPAAPAAVFTALMQSRIHLEDAGYRADSCLVAGTEHYLMINQLVDGVSVAQGLLKAANLNSLYRASQLGKPPPGGPDLPGAPYSVMVGRRRQIAHRGAATASPGEEPVDIAVSLPPSLEVVGDNDKGQIELGVRIRFAVRIKDAGGLVVLHAPPSDVAAN